MRGKSYNESLEAFREYLARHELIEQPWSTEDVRAFRLRKPGDGRSGSVDILFMDKLGQILITGDLCPGLHGTISTHGYGLRWFLGRFSRGYTETKFSLEQAWRPELALEGLDELLAEEQREHAEEVAANDDEREASDDDDDEDDSRHGRRVRAIHEATDCVENGDAHGVYEALTDVGYESEDVPGHGYNPRDVALLRAIQERFAALFVDSTAQPAQAPAPAFPAEPPSRFEQALAETEAHLARERARLEEG